MFSWHETGTSINGIPAINMSTLSAESSKIYQWMYIPQIRPALAIYYNF